MGLPSRGQSFLGSLLVLGGLWAGPLSAQHLLYTEHEGQMHLVRGARGQQPLVRLTDKLVAGFGRKFILKRTDEYLPVTVFLRNIDVKTGGLRVSGARMNNGFRFHALVETPFDLQNVFLVLELDTQNEGTVIFLQEIGELAPYETIPVDASKPLSVAIGPGRYRLHLFCGGEEILHSEMKPEYREHVLDVMAARRIAGARDSAPRLFVSPDPEYPADLRKRGIAGQAVIAVRVGADGRVHDPAVTSATDPAFGQAALASIRLSRFLPRVKDGHPVEAVVDVPVEFKAGGRPPGGKP